MLLQHFNYFARRHIVFYAISAFKGFGSEGIKLPAKILEWKGYVTVSIGNIFIVIALLLGPYFFCGMVQHLPEVPKFGTRVAIGNSVQDLAC